MTIRPESKLHYIFVLFAFLCSGMLHGQQKDFGTWWEFKADGGFNNGIGLSGELEQRMDGNSLQYDRTLLTVGSNYDLKDYLNVSAGFRTVFITDREMRLHTRYRIHADARVHHLFSRTDLSFRLRFQYGFEDILFIGYFSQNNFLSRQRLKISHDIFGTRLRAFGSLENWIRFNDLYGLPFYKIRFTAGTQYRFSLHSRLSIRYILEHEFNTLYPTQYHILALGYSYKF